MHSTLAQMLYADTFVAVQAPIPEIQHGAELMYYGGDITEMLLAFAVVTTWRPVRTRTGRQAHVAEGLADSREAPEHAQPCGSPFPSNAG